MSTMGHNHEIFGPSIAVVQNELQEGWITLLFVTKEKNISSWSFSQAGVKFHNRLMNSTWTQPKTETDGNISSPPI